MEDPVRAVASVRRGGEKGHAEEDGQTETLSHALGKPEDNPLIKGSEAIHLKSKGEPASQRHYL
jgi:hypothetical protein